MNPIQFVKINCPYCGEGFSTMIDFGAIDITLSGQTWIEDCGICCQPINLFFYVDEESAGDQLQADEDASELDLLDQDSTWGGVNFRIVAKRQDD